MASAPALRLSALDVPDLEVPAGAGDVTISDVTADSRKVGPGSLFAALPGSKADGASFAATAVAAGAVAVLAPRGTALPDLPVPVLRASDPRRALALVAARIYPRQPAVAVAVTGTAGKTSVADFTRQLFVALGRPAASVGTIGVIRPSGAVYGSLTTPDPVDLHRTLDDLAGEGVTHLAFEASSHGLDQRRLDGVRLTAAAFTNLGRDHLDYHPDMDSYLAAKLRLFRDLLQPGQVAVVNADGDRASDVVAAAGRRGLAVFTTGRAGADLKLAASEARGMAGQRLSIVHASGRSEVELPLIGAYQVENALVAAGLAIATGEDTAAVLAALSGLEGVPGRLEIIGRRNGAMAVVDYAHKPEALAAALAAVRPFATARVICVFGCGGDRDRGKRPIMGEIASRLSDVVIVTDDNPRSERPAAIRAEILATAPGAIEIGDRAEAIGRAIAMAGPGDVVLVAGKGHETGQIIGATTVPFSDADEITKALESGA